MIHSTLDVLRLLTISLALFSVGVNLAIFRHCSRRHERMLIVGRIGLLFSIILIVSIRLSHVNYMEASYLFNIVLIISLLTIDIGGYRYYKSQEEEHDKSVR